MEWKKPEGRTAAESGGSCSQVSHHGTPDDRVHCAVTDAFQVLPVNRHSLSLAAPTAFPSCARHTGGSHVSP